MRHKPADPTALAHRVVELRTRANPLLEQKAKSQVVDPDDITAPMTFKRKIRSARDRLQFFRQETARATVANFQPGDFVFGLTKGQFSLLDFLTALLEKTGPATVDISTWTASHKDLDGFEQLAARGLMTRCRWLLDLTFQRREPQMAQRIRDLFGPDSMRVTKVHAKFLLIRNNTWSVSAPSSMNLNMNPRIENFLLVDDRAMADFLQEFMDDIFKRAPRATRENGDAGKQTWAIL